PALNVAPTRLPDSPGGHRLHAGVCALGVPGAHGADEQAAALAINSVLRRAVAFWEEQLHPLSSLAASAEPPPGTWQAIEVRIRTTAAKPVAHSFWTNLAFWRWSTAGFAAAAAALALWIAVTSVPGPSLVAILHPPQQDQASWIATAGRSGLVLRAVTTATPPRDRAFELWAIAPGATQPRSLGVISPNSELKLSRLPPD